MWSLFTGIIVLFIYYVLCCTKTYANFHTSEGIFFTIINAILKKLSEKRSGR
ncbi:hypothetical protein LAD12857_34180 [Lacrimispora amygdalina]|uniref:Uncharacterized protein n=1 Tax=Lacrimispora amygdalina TaxID=253257 RepID=A0ABQ5M963_9FIRM